MSRMKKLLASLTCILLIATLALVGCQTAGTGDNGGSGNTGGTDSQNPLGLIHPGQLIVGSDCDYPPFIYMDGEQATGFEYDLMVAIAADMNLELVYLPPQNFDTLPTQVAGGGKMDLAVSSLTITEARKLEIDFGIPYFDSNQACVALATKPFTSTSDLSGMTVGAQSGTTGAAWAEENIPGVTVLTYERTSDALAALQAGQVEAIFFDEPVAAEQVNGEYTDCHIVEVIPTGEQYAFAFSKDNPALREAVDASLQRLISNGTYARIFANYFDFEPTVH